ncbi:class IV adenylate cyclase [Treponema sp.]|uniref:class IV adenylate cyclase n=1 Tax=Treponema sp. TaxID=166 RepID=UPI00257E333B|nr:class IV adenylate cyclase [Treponema sp.]MBE6353996.1 class IV adenylate cyclase [Treponema sp.]
MNEIELKARVSDRKKLTDTLNSFACFKGSLVRDDRYFAKKNEDGTFSKKKIRIRTQTENDKKTFILTWKRKELQQDSNGTQIEVNDEHECILSDDDCLVTFLEDTGYSVALQKHKEVSLWTYEEASFELCTVPPLGDFLEIEILTDSDSPEKIAEIKEKLGLLLLKAGLSASDIEPKMYSQMLEEVKSL